MVSNAVPAKSTGAFSNTQCDIMRQFLKSLGILICKFSGMHGLGGVIKQRISRPAAGKSSGYRSIVIFRKEDKAFFVFGFQKNAQDNIRDDEEDQFKKAAKITLALTDEQINLLIANGQFEEVSKDD